ncbi:hypothetical protein SARC_14434 [Sphaeroforma arctica JP610]|uniref:Homologous recombination OB-fold protein OB-fold domain-containing protein n=1 Tax=Sphaeroforma arctica JP610 TaxID=667725 RepID=A0A0L0F8G2_9EUKA|nr:hypothetical protein SARC_14434 [Sphaeroforma arctica JP610]KNC73005.1 hypothetical protein SARC_14434 [Sphaeroforma arctica JP610]|eukprot:XP_014146907.1 hypothetical protein SARC_14434 [Sphaeroforma arctica JP610]
MYTSTVGTGGWVAMLQYTCLLRNYQYFCKGDRLALKNTMLAYSIQYIVDLAVMCKIPYLAVMVRSLANPGSRVCTIFRDPSGEIPGELHRKVLQRYHDLRVGDVMVLKNVSVLYPNPTECFLNITLNNIDRVFSHKGEDLTATTENHEQTGTERQRASRLESNSRGTHRNK